MEIYTGADIIEISRFTDDLLHNTKFLNHCFTANEQNYCFSKNNPAQHFAARFAAKEAITKAVSGFGKTIGYSDIEVQNQPNGRPFIILHTEEEVLLKLKIDISLSHCETTAIAFAVVYL